MRSVIHRSVAPYKRCDGSEIYNTSRFLFGHVSCCSLTTIEHSYKVAVYHSLYSGGIPFQKIAFAFSRSAARIIDKNIDSPELPYDGIGKRLTTCIIRLIQFVRIGISVDELCDPFRAGEFTGCKNDFCTVFKKRIDYVASESGIAETMLPCFPSFNP